MLKRVAVTGGIASGKSTVCRVFQELGAYVVSADQITHQLLSPMSVLSQQVVLLLGTQIVRGGSIDRKTVADLVFSDPEKLHALEALIHPAVFKEIEREYSQEKQQPHSLFVAEIPLLFETGREGDYDVTVAVVAPEKQCIERFCRSGQSEDEYHKRMKCQQNPYEKAVKADYVIENSGTMNDLTNRAKEIFYSIQPKREIS
jgi:dephospho-CoA kinase